MFGVRVSVMTKLSMRFVDALIDRYYVFGYL